MAQRLHMCNFCCNFAAVYGTEPIRERGFAGGVAGAARGRCHCLSNGHSMGYRLRCYQCGVGKEDICAQATRGLQIHARSVG